MNFRPVHKINDDTFYTSPNDAGNIKFTISANGKSFSGTWTYGSNGSGGTWVGTKVK